MVVETLHGFIKILKEKNWDFKEIISRVATKGGATEEGVIVLNEGLPNVFDLVFKKTLRKQDARKELIQAQFHQEL